jgi:hypothetical protein
MRRMVVVDENGHILATGPDPDELARFMAAVDGAPSATGVIPLPDQRVLVMDLPKDFQTIEDLARLHTGFRVAGTETALRLVARNTA